MARERTPPPTPRAACVRSAGDLFGVNQLIAELDIGERTFHSWATGKRPVPDGVLPEIRKLLIQRRQELGRLVEAVRAVEQGKLDELEQQEDPPCD